MPVSTNALLDANSKYERHKQDVDLLFDALERDGRLTERYKADALKRIAEIRATTMHLLDKVHASATDPYLTAEGQERNKRQAGRTAMETLTAFEEKTVRKIQEQEASKRSTYFAPKRPTDVAEAVIHEMRQRELRDKLASMDPLILESKLRLADDTAMTWLPALESAPAGFGIVGPEVLNATKAAIAERLDPQIGELAQLRSAYTYALGIARQTVLAATGGDPVSLATDAVTPSDPRQPYTLSSVEVKP